MKYFIAYIDEGITVVSEYSTREQMIEAARSLGKFVICVWAEPAPSYKSPYELLNIPTKRDRNEKKERN